MKLIAKLSASIIAPLLLSGCFKSIDGVTFTACYDKVCGSVGISTNKGTPSPAPTSSPTPLPQTVVVKDAGK